MKKASLIWGLALSLIVIVFSSCSREGGETAKYNIEFMNWETSPEGIKFTQSLIREFEKENPGIRVKDTLVASRSYFSKLLTRFAGGSPPDIFEIQAEIIYPFLKKGLLLNLSPYIKKSAKLNEDDFFPVSLVNFRYDGASFRKGALYGFPKDISTAALIYNKDLFDKAGLSYPESTWTEKEYLAAAKKLTKRDNSGRIIRLGIDRPLRPLDILLDKGGKIWSSDYKKCLLDSPAAIEAYQFVYDLQEVDKVALSPRKIREGVGGSVGFKSGKAGMSLVYRYELPDLTKYIGDRFAWGIAPLPSFNGAHKQLLHGPSGWAISEKTKYPEASFKFMEFLVGEKGQIATAKLGWNIPANKKIASSDYFLKDLKRKDSEKINRIFLQAMDDLNPTLLNPYISISQVYTILQETLDVDIIRKYKGKVGIPLKKAVKRINAVIEENMRSED
jgi:multiple sugar transport system substrate-binding protein